jgi:DNA primase
VSRITKSSIQEVHNRIDAITVVEEYVRLEKRGGRYWGRCPFHAGGQEKTPSFTVDPDQKLYYCFGCRKGGGIVDFVMEMDKSGYPETIKNLARKCGVELIYEGGGEEDNEDWQAEQSRKEQLYELYRRTALSFSHFLKEKPEGKAALDYLLSRSISPAMIDSFRLGYAPADRDWLYRFLQGKGYSAEFLDASGLFSANYRGMAFFADRLMFPIADQKGRVAAFGGRAMPDARADTPKYINTREIETYKKSQVLYALDLALPEIRRTKTVYLAEGYMDVIALHQAGISNAVAPCGTAFTAEQAKLLRNWADTAVLVFDSDEAGRKAAVKGVITCRANGLACFLLAAENGEDIPPGTIKDPADILQKFGTDTLTKVMKNVILDLEYIIAQSKAQYDTATPQGKARAFAMLYPYFDALASKTERDDCIRFAADEMRAEKGAVLADYERWQRGADKMSGRNAPQSNSEEVPAAEPVIRMNDELFALAVVSVNTHLYAEFRAAIEMREIEDPVAKELFIALEESFRDGDTGAFASRIASQAIRNFIIEKGISAEFKGDSKCDPRKLMEDGIRRVKAKRLRRRLSEIGAELRLGERGIYAGINAGGGLDDDLIAEKMYIDAEIRKLEGKTG